MRRVNFAYVLCLTSLLLSNQSWAEPTMVQNQYSPSPVATQWANRGLDLANQGDYGAAIENLFEAWKLHPQRSNDFAAALSIVYNNHAKQLLEKGQLDEAISKLRWALFFNEENKTASANLDKMLRNKQLNPQDFKLRLKEAQTLRNSGRVHEAVAEYLKAIELAKAASPEQIKAKLELAQVYKVIFSIYASNPVGQARLEKMFILCQELLKLNPKDGRPNILLGSAYLIKQKLPESIAAFEEALKSNPNEREALDGLVGAWRKVVEIAPNEADNLFGLGSALMRGGYNDEGTSYLKRAKALDPNNQDIDKMLALSKQKEEESELFRVAERGLEAQKAGKLDQAIDLYQIALRKLPPSPEAATVYYNLGLAYQAKGQTSDAVQAFNQAIKFDPANDESRKAIQKINQQAVLARVKMSEQAVTMQSQGRIQEAINLYLKLLKDSPDDAQTHFNLGTAYQQQNRYKEALQEYKTASSLAPGNSEFKNAVSTLQQAIDSGAFDAAEATEVLKQAITLQQAGKVNQSIDKYKEALALDPKNAQAHFNLGTAYHSQSRNNEAIGAYKQAYRLDPSGFPEANYFIANLLEAQKKYSDALAYYKRYLEDQPQAAYSKEAEERVKLLSNP